MTQKATPAKLPAWFVPYTRWRFIGLRFPKALAKYPRPVFPRHITAEVQWVLDEWKRYAAWEAWVLGGKKGPRPAGLWKNVAGNPISPGWAGDTLKLVRQHTPPKPPPPPPIPSQPPVDHRMQNVSVGAWSPWDALRWPGCRIWLSADPAESLSRYVKRADADSARHDGHDIGVWYVPDQVSHDRAREAADILGTDLIAADCETLGRWRIAHESGVTRGIANLSALWEDAECNHAIATGAFHVTNEFYWNQAKYRQPDNHNLPVDSLCIAVYNGCSDSQEADCWEPHVADYKAAGHYWPTMSVYQQNMTTADWDALPRIP